jgi:Lrp/AsnC family transcriptional regulator, regulator for asnA, asnC and gidA
MAPAKPDLDEIDLAIIQMLREDGRRAYSSIAQDLGLAPSTVQQRATRLLDSGVLTIKAMVHPADLDHPVIAMVAVKANGAYLSSAAEALALIPEVRWTVICAGSYDIMVEVVCRDNRHLLSLISDCLATIEGVRETVTFLYLDIVKRAQEWTPPESGGDLK